MTREELNPVDRLIAAEHGQKLGELLDKENLLDFDLIKECYNSLAFGFLWECAKNDELQKELLEQSRLNGMGSEREAKLISKCDDLVKALESIACFDKEEMSSEIYWMNKYKCDEEIAETLVNDVVLARKSISKYRGEK